MGQNVEFGRFSIEKIDRKAVIALLAGLSLGVMFWSALILFIAG